MLRCFKADGTFLLINVRKSKMWAEFERAESIAERFSGIYNLCKHASVGQTQLCYGLLDHFDGRGLFLCSEVLVRQDLQCD